MPVEKTNVRARFQSHWTSDGHPATNAPAAPNAFPKVPTTASARTSACAQRPRPDRAQHPECVRFVDHERGAVLVAQSAQREEIRRVGVHAEIGLCHNEGPARAPAPERAVDGPEVEMWHDGYPGARQANPIDDRGVIEDVADYEIVRFGESREKPHVCGVAAGKDERFWRADEICGGALQLNVFVSLPGDQPGRSGSRGGRWRLATGQIEVVV